MAQAALEKLIFNHKMPTEHKGECKGCSLNSALIKALGVLI